MSGATSTAVVGPSESGFPTQLTYRAGHILLQTTSSTGDLVLSAGDLLDIDAAGALSLNSSGGVLNIGNDADAQNINIGTGASARTITIGNVTGATAVAINSGTGSITMTSTGAGDIVINSDDTLLLDADGVLELNSSAGAIGIGNDADAQDINIGTGAAARNITVGNDTGATSVTLTSGSGGVNITGTGSSVSIESTGANNIIVSAGGQLSLTGTTGTVVTSAIFTGGSITGVTTLTAANSGTTYAVTQDGGGFAITLPTAAAGLNYKFVIVVAGAGTVTIDTPVTTDNHFFGVIVNDVTSVLSINAQDRISLIGGTAAVGDIVELSGISATQWMVKAITSAAGGITVSDR